MTTSGIYDSLTVYGAHAVGALCVTAGVCKLAKAINDYYFNVEKSETKSEKSLKTQKANLTQQDSKASLQISFPKFLVPALGLCAGLATTWWIATSPNAQSIAISMLTGASTGAAIRGEQGKIAEVQIQSLIDTIGPQFSSIPSICAGVAATALSCWMFGKIS